MLPGHQNFEIHLDPALGFKRIDHIKYYQCIEALSAVHSCPSTGSRPGLLGVE